MQPGVSARDRKTKQPFELVESGMCCARKVNIRLPGKGNSTRKVDVIKWIRTRRLSITNSLCGARSLGCPQGIAKRGNHRATLLIRNCNLLGPYSRTVPRALWWPKGGVLFLMSEVPLYSLGCPQGIAKRGNYGSFPMDDFALTVRHNMTF